MVINRIERITMGILSLMVILAGCQAGDGNGGGNGGTTPAQNPIPTLSSMTPDAAVTRMPAFALEVKGNGFVDGARVVFNDRELDTAFVDSTTLTATVEPGSTSMSAAGGNSLSPPRGESVTVRVRNPSPGGGDSGSLDFTIHANFVFETPRPISDPGHDAYHGKIHVTADGRVEAAWHETWGSDNRRARMRHSGDGGESWSPIHTISASASSVNPTLCRDGDDALHCVFAYTAKVPGSALRHTISTDNGATWSTPVTIRGSDFGAYPLLIAGADGTIHLICRALEVTAFRLDDNGASWGTGVEISSRRHSPTDLDACRDEKDNLFVLWSQAVGKDPTDTRLWFSRSLNSGMDWLAPQIVRELGPWNSTNHVSLAAGTNRHLAAAWSLFSRTGYGNDFPVEFRSANKSGNVWSALKRMHSAGSNAGSSELCTDPAGNVHLFLTDDAVQRDAFRLRFRRSTDNGMFWTSAVFVKNVTRRYLDPSAACDAAGNVYGVFTDKLNGRNTVFFTRSRIP